MRVNQATPQEKRKPLRVLVLGCGSIGRRHVRNLLALKVPHITAFDPAPEVLARARQDSGVETVDSLGLAWEREPYAVVISAPTQAHVSLALEAAERGCHLFIEKPLSHSRGGLDRLMAEVDRQGLVTMVGCNMRFHPGPACVKELLQEGTIGEILWARLETGSFLPRWRSAPDYRESYSASPKWGGAILDCIHEIDLALWFFGPAKVVGAAHLPARSIGLETDGLAEILLRHDSGVLSSIHLNFIQRDVRRRYQIIGGEGTLDWDLMENRGRLFGPEGEPRREYCGPEGWEMNRMYLDELRHFLQALRAKRTTVNPVTQAAAALEIALTVREKGFGIGYENCSHHSGPDVFPPAAGEDPGRCSGPSDALLCSGPGTAGEID